MNDFVTEEFMTKNIRVRPMSGVRDFVDDRQSEHYSRANLMSGMMDSGLDEDEKFNKMVNLEMEEQRRKQKQAREEAQRKKQMEADRIAKQNAKKNK